MVTLKETTSSIAASRNRRFLRAQTALEKVVEILIKKYHVSRIMLIGSLLDKNRFGFHSDIDLCVGGLSDELYFKALGELLLTTVDFDIDIIPFEGLTPKVRERIEKGKILYEKR